MSYETAHITPPNTLTTKGTLDFSPGSVDLFAEVIIPLALPTNYTWFVPQEFRANLHRGSRVEVELKNKRYSGIIKTLHQNKPQGFTPKPIINVLDADPMIFETQLSLWAWMAEYYMCSEGEIMQAALPSHLKLSSESILTFNEEYGDDFTDLGDEEYLVAEALLLKKELKLSEVQQVLDATHVYPVIKKLVEKKVCIVWEALTQKYQSKMEVYVSLSAEFHNEENLAKLLNEWSKNKAPKQLELLLAYLHLIKTEGIVTQASLLKKSGASSAQLKGLADKNIVSRSEQAMAQAKVDQVAAEVALAKLHLSFTEIRAPFDGTLDRIPKKLGSLIDEGELLTSLSDNSEMFAYFNVSEPEYLDYKADARASSNTKVNLLLANNQRLPYSGVVETV